MIDVREIAQLHRATVERWHDDEISNPYSGLLAVVCNQHAFNFRLWHQEDIARCPDSDDSTIAQVKRNIDKLNQQRNDWIERIDDFLTQMLAERNVQLRDKAPINTETPGCAIDRLSILSLRIYHLEEQLSRSDVSEAHLGSVRDKISICELQRDELVEAVQQLLSDIGAGRKRHRTYRQLKMYNDAALNPYLYRRAGKRAA